MKFRFVPERQTWLAKRPGLIQVGIRWSGWAGLRLCRQGVFTVFVDTAGRREVEPSHFILQSSCSHTLPDTCAGRTSTPVQVCCCFRFFFNETFKPVKTRSSCCELKEQRAESSQVWSGRSLKWNFLKKQVPHSLHQAPGHVIIRVWDSTPGSEQTFVQNQQEVQALVTLVIFCC